MLTKKKHLTFWQVLFSFMVMMQKTVGDGRREEGRFL
jgi:hypothetical protein